MGIVMTTRIAACTILILCSGCAIGLNHPDMRIASSLALSDITDEIITFERYIEHFEKTVSVGRFPTGIAIVRLVTTTDPETNRQKLRILPFRGFENPYWTQLFDGTSEVRSLFAIHKKSVRDEYVTIPELIEASHVLNAGLMLVFGYDNSSFAYSCTVFGLLYEIPSGKLIAGVQNDASINQARKQAALLPRRKWPVSAEDWAFYVDHVAFRGFEKKFKKCVWDLIDRDKQTQALKPNPFEDAMPPYNPLFWVPPR